MQPEDSPTIANCAAFLTPAADHVTVVGEQLAGVSGRDRWLIGGLLVTEIDDQADVPNGPDET